VYVLLADVLSDGVVLESDVQEAIRWLRPIRDALRGLAAELTDDPMRPRRSPTAARRSRC
jgi:hypothetical protein